MNKPMNIRQLLVEREETMPYLPDATITQPHIAAVHTTHPINQVTTTWFDAHR